MMELRCPWCGPRDESEFSYGGERVARPDAPDINHSKWAEYLYVRGNARGWVREHWVHTHGCAQWFIVTRHTVTHAIRGTHSPGTDDIKVPL